MAVICGVHTNTAGGIITLFDSVLVTDANWSIYDASAGTNAKVYLCTGAVTFYLWIGDNQTDYFNVRIWQTWDSGTHTGSGWNTASLQFPKHLTNNHIFLNGYRFIWVIYNESYSFVNYCGEIERINTGNTYCVVTGVIAYPTYYSCLHMSGWWIEWRLGRSDAGTANCAAGCLGGFGPFLYTEDMEGINHTIKTGVFYSETNYYFIGYLKGIKLFGGTFMKLVQGEKICINGSEWIGFMDNSTSPNKRFILVEMV